MVLGLRVNFYKSSISGINLSSDFLEVASFFFTLWSFSSSVQISLYSYG